MECNLSPLARQLLQILRDNHEGDMRRDTDGVVWYLVRANVTADSGIERSSLGGLYSKLRRAGLYNSLDVQSKWGEVRAKSED